MGAETRIHVLPTHVANKIAAGEVVERPASVVKELVENSVDAGATQIDVLITAGGRKRIAVHDNGSGMGRDDALLAIEKQATSKIREVDDIEHIHTLGFRGEALAAIASVSRFRLTTCGAAGEPGTEVNVTGGRFQDVREVGCPVGTTIEVRDLFFNVPARRKFMRSHETELAHVRSGFVVLALANARIGMSLNVDGRDVYRLAPAALFVDRLRDLFGPDFLKGLMPVEAQGAVSVSGFISRPGFTRADREELFLFVNGRATTSPVLAYALREGYHTALPRDRHPSVFLFIDVDPESVDVNVHPTKREVRFRRSSEVRDAVVAAIRGAHARGVVAPGGEPAAAPLFAPPPWTGVQMHIDGLPPTRLFQYPRATPPAGDPGGPGFGGTKAAPAPSTSPAAGAEPAVTAGTPPPEGSAAPWAWCRVVGQIGGQYVLLETEDGLVVMDPRAAHERVLYENFLSQVTRHAVPGQNLLLPETVTLRPADADRVRRYLDLMKGMGFGIAEFGGDAFVVDVLPACLAQAAAQDLLAEVAAGLEAAGGRRGVGNWREDLVAQAACRAAVKSRDRLKLEELEQLVVDLARTEMPYTCPRGRPTLIFTSRKELDRKFGRE